MKISDVNLIDEEYIEERKYQNDLFDSCRDNSSLIVLPTGVGKTLVAISISLYRLDNIENSKSVFLTPTKPLGEQQVEAFREFSTLEEEKIGLFTGEVKPEDREELWDDLRIIVTTPQTLENDLINDRVSLENVSHITFDECHRATGDYAYVNISEDYDIQGNNILKTGLTASPGSDISKIEEVCENISVSNIEVYSDDDEELSEYMYDKNEKEIWVDLDDDIKEIQDLIKSRYKDVLSNLKENGVIKSSSISQSFSNILKAQKKVRGKISESNADSSVYQNMSLIAEAMQINQILEVLETQGVREFVKYVDNLDTSSSKAVERLLSQREIVEAINKGKEYDKQHPKISRLNAIVASRLVDDKKALIFTQSRDTAQHLVEFFEGIGKAEVDKLIGQSNKEGDPGMSQSEQKDVIRRFGEDEIDILVSTQVGEEGLDIPEVDLVVFYEPVPSDIRMIQRRGRTGRSKEGEVITLIAKDTRDVGYYYSAKNKEEQMLDNIKKLKKEKDELEQEVNQSSLDNFSENQEVEETKEEKDLVEVIVDNREMKSQVVRKLSKDKDITIDTRQLEVGDYIASSKCGIERKSVDDFLHTISGERSFFEQAKNLVNNYEDPVYIIEGDLEKLYSRNIHQNAIVGFLVSLSMDFGVRIMPSKGEENTYRIIKSIAENQQLEKDTEVSEHSNKAMKKLSEKQEYLVSSFPNIGPKTSRQLLEEFGSIYNLVNASKDEISQVQNVGDKKAKEIYKIVNEEYN